MSLGKMSRWIAVRRSSQSSSSVREDGRQRRAAAVRAAQQAQHLQRHHSAGDVCDIGREAVSGEMRIIQLKSSPGMSRRAVSSQSDSTASEKPVNSNGSPGLGFSYHSPVVEESIAENKVDPSIDDAEDEIIAEPGYALPSECKRMLSNGGPARTSTPLNGRIASNGFGVSTPSQSSTPASTISSQGKGSNEMIRQERQEAVEDRAGGYDVVCLDDVKAASASLPRMVRDSSVVDESVYTGPIRREDYLRKLGRRFKSWKRRWVALHPTELSFFKTGNIQTPSRIIPTEVVIDVFYPASVPYPFGHSFEVVTSKRSHILATKTETAARAWVHLIQRASGKTRRSASVQCLGSGRSSASPTTVTHNGVEIEAYAQAVVPRNCRPQQAAEPTYAIASRTSPSRKESLTQAALPEGRWLENGDEDAPPVPPKLSALHLDDAEDDDSSDDGEETRDVLDECLHDDVTAHVPPCNASVIAVQQAAHTSKPSCSATPPLSNGQGRLSSTADSSTFHVPEDSEDLGVVFF